jgi:carbon monoxide dehydrogenase subunit G
MKFENTCVIPAPCSDLWDFMTVIPSVAKCLPGVEEVNELEAGKYSGIIVVRVGIVKMRLSGKMTVEVMDKASRTAVMSVQAADQRISGMIQGKLTMHMEGLSPQETKLTVETDLNLFGKIGEFGGPIIKKKADQMTTEFAKNVAIGVAAASK